MELFQSQDNFIIVNGTHSLWCNRQDGRLQARIGMYQLRGSAILLDLKSVSDRFHFIDFMFFFLAGVDLGEAWSLRCRGIVYGIIGKIQFFPGKFFHPPVLNFYYVYFLKVIWQFL